MTKNALPKEALAQHLAIVGRTGSGKTYTAKGLVENLLDEQRRVCILDPTGAWYGLRSSADGKRAGYPVAVFGGAHGDVPIAEHSGAALAAILAEKNLPAIIDLSEMLIGQRHRFVTDFAEAIYRLNKAVLHLVIDEADEFCPQNPMPETKRMLHHVDRIVRRGRIKGFRVMLITQRPAVLHKNVLTQANTLIAMRLTAPQDRKAIQAWVEGQADASKAKAVLESLASLKRGEGWVWAPEHDLLERVTFPRITTFDSSRAPDENESIAEPTKLADVDIGEIKASFAEIEREVETMAEMKAELVKLRRLKTPTDKGVSEAEVQRRIREAVAEHKRQHPPGVLVNDGSEQKALRRIFEIAQKAISVDVALAPVPSSDVIRERVREVTAEHKRNAGVSAPQQRIIDVIAQLGLMGIEAPNRLIVAAHAGVSPRSSGYANNLGALRTLGLIDYPASGAVALTDSGAAVASCSDRAPTLADIHDSFLRVISAPQAAILRALLGCYPKAMTRDELAHRIDVSSKSSGYMNNLGSLRTLGAIDYPATGSVRATELMFPQGKK